MSAFAAQLIETYTGVELRYNYRRFQREHLISSNERQAGANPQIHADRASAKINERDVLVNYDRERSMRHGATNFAEDADHCQAVA